MSRHVAPLCAAAAFAGALPFAGCADSALPDVGEARLVKDLQPGPASSDPGGFWNVGSVVLFSTANGRLWRTDGTAAGTIPLADAGPGVARAGGTRFFAFTDAAHGSELWKTDGTAVGTTLVRDINPGPYVQGSGGSSSPREFTEAAGTVLFMACDGSHGWELWKTDGTDAGTVMVEDIDPRSFSTPRDLDECLGPAWRHQDLSELNGRLYFLADDGAAGLGLWRSDGTAEGTVLVQGVPREAPTNPRDTRAPVEHLTKAVGRLFFTSRSALWSSDGTAAGTRALPLVASDVFAGTPSALFFLWHSGIGRTDGTAAGTYTLKELRMPTIGRQDAVDTRTAVVGDRLYFLGPGSDLWTSDGTPAGTVPVAGVGTPGTPAEPSALTPVDGTLYFLASDEEHHRQLWRVESGGRGRRLTEIEGQVAPQYADITLGSLRGLVLFPARDGEHGRELWAYRTR